MTFTKTSHRPRLAATTTTVAIDCNKQVRSWRLLRTIVQLLLPSCYCTLADPNDNQEDKSHRLTKPRTSSATANSSFTGTIFGFRRGKVNFCIQATNSKTLNPIIVLLELTVPTEVLAREMRGGVLRIALESNNNNEYDSVQESSSFCPLLTTPLWNMYCNGRKVGFAIKREPSKAELAALKVLTPVTEGAGVVNGEEINRDKSDHMMYLKASFKRVFGSFDSESFHLIDPNGIIGQELSIFFFRSSRK